MFIPTLKMGEPPLFIYFLNVKINGLKGIRADIGEEGSITLYMGPNPPCPSLLDKWKLFVALASFLTLNSGSSWILT